MASIGQEIVIKFDRETVEKIDKLKRLDDRLDKYIELQSDSSVSLQTNKLLIEIGGYVIDANLIATIGVPEIYYKASGSYVEEKDKEVEYYYFCIFDNAIDKLAKLKFDSMKLLVEKREKLIAFLGVKPL